jgi:pimeloyl-ACP methyl ester carboxylesterase
MQTINAHHMAEPATTSVIEAGTGAPVVLLHGPVPPSARWHHLAASLAQSFHVLALDLHGGGGSDGQTADAGPTLATDALRASEIMAQSAEPGHLVGYSYGAAVALRLALTQPDQVRSLALIEPAAFHVLRSGPSVQWWLRDKIAEAAARIFEETSGAAGWPCHTQFAALWNGARTPPPYRKEPSAARHGDFERVVRAFKSAVAEQTPLAAYHRVRAPTLILYGRNAPWVIRSVADLLAATMPNARQASLDDAGHISPAAQQELLYAAVAAHLGANTDPIRKAA